MRVRILSVVIPALLSASCSTAPPVASGTLAALREVRPDMTEVEVSESMNRAIGGYRRFLTETSSNRLTPEAMRRLADLQIEREFGIFGGGEIIEVGDSGDLAALGQLFPFVSSGLAGTSEDESVAAFEDRAGAPYSLPAPELAAELDLPPGFSAEDLRGPLEAIAIYQRLLDEYPHYERADQVLYQMARAYEEIGQPDEAMAVMDQLAASAGYSALLDEIQFRRGEYLFTRRAFREAESAYEAIIAMGPNSRYYELALYKLGWALYKQEFYDEALHRFMALLDYRHAEGFDVSGETIAIEEDRRIEDTFRVISLSFSNLGGPEIIGEYFAENGNRDFDARIYRNLGEFYLEKLRYQDAAQVYRSFVEANEFHAQAPRFSMRIIEIYEEGEFPILVVDSKKEFAAAYGLSKPYWNYFDPDEAPEVLSFLKTNLTDLAAHYHALYQNEELVDDKDNNFSEASLWYREFLTSFPAAPETPPINYQLADLLFENENFGFAAVEYERTAYDYAEHQQAAEAGYRAVNSYRLQMESTVLEEKPQVLRAAVDSSLKFADVFPGHEQAAPVLNAAARDLFDMKDYQTAMEAALILTDRYASGSTELLRSGWTVAAHSAFELEMYAGAEANYSALLGFVPNEDPEHAGFVDNLAAAIYQQGEEASVRADYRAAADHFLRVGESAPTASIVSAAEYDAAAALVKLEDWATAGRVLENFRAAFPGHELQSQVTRQLASVYRSAGALDRSAAEYIRVADESSDPQLQAEVLLLAGELYEESGYQGDAVGTYLRYIEAFPQPLDMAQETRFKVAQTYLGWADDSLYRDMLQQLVNADAAAGEERSDRSRYLAATSALVLTEDYFTRYAGIQLVQPFDISLAAKRDSLDSALAAFEGLVDYEISEVTAAATYYIAELYADFSQALLGSERPNGLDGAAMVDYELALEEEAFPFEELAIDVHEENFALVAKGIFNPWVQRSMGKLADLMPGRYSKGEISSGYIGSIDFYAYRSPVAPSNEAVADEGSEVPPQAALQQQTAQGESDAGKL